MRKQTDLTSNGQAMALILKLIEETADMASIGHAKVLVLKLIEETSRHDFEKACKGARPPTN